MLQKLTDFVNAALNCLLRSFPTMQAAEFRANPEFQRLSSELSERRKDYGLAVATRAQLEVQLKKNRTNTDLKAQLEQQSKDVIDLRAKVRTLEGEVMRICLNQTTRSQLHCDDAPDAIRLNQKQSLALVALAAAWIILFAIIIVKHLS